MQLVIDGILTNYIEYGTSEKPCLLILHGWGNDIASWKNVASTLSDKWHVLLLDLPGFGATNRPEKTFDTYDYANFVEAFLTKLNILEFSILGHSFGGRIGIIISSRSTKVQRLILVDSAGIGDFSSIYRKMVGFLKMFRPIIPKSLMRRLRRHIGSTDYIQAGEMKDVFLKVIAQDLTHLLSRISCATLIIWGDRDDILDIKLALAFKEKIKGSKVRVVWGAKHHPHIEKPTEFIEILNEELYV